MTTPLVMLGLLAGPLLIALLLNRLGAQPRLGGAGIVGLVLLFFFTASGHFVQTEPMTEMLPAFVPGRVALVYLTGLLEIAIAVGLAIPATRHTAGMAAIAALVLFFPANVYAAVNHVGMGGHEWGPVYLLIRAPLQATLIGWTWWFAVRPESNAATVAGSSA
jgi:uncharacterized membrane protein